MPSDVSGGIQAGDLIYVVAMHTQAEDYDTNHFVSVLDPGGAAISPDYEWPSSVIFPGTGGICVGPWICTAGNAPSNPGLAVFTWIADGGEDGDTIQGTATPDTSDVDGWTAIAFVIRGAHTGEMYEVIQTASTATDQEPDPPSATPLTANSMSLVIAYKDETQTTELATPAAQTNYTLVGFRHRHISTGGEVAIEYQILDASLSAVNPGTWTLGGDVDEWGAIHMMIRPVVAPTVTTNAETNVGVSSATLNGEITATGGETGAGTEHGFAWGTLSTLSGGDTSTTTLGNYSGTGVYSQNVSSLLSNKIYYFRAYAINSAGTGYGSVIENFTTGTDFTPSRKMRLFEGFRIILREGGRIILHQQ